MARARTAAPAVKADAPTSGGDQARRFGKLVREYREALGLRQDDVALATGVGRRFIVELEGGKANCQLGKALLVAEAVGLRPFDLLTEGKGDNALLPDLSDDELPDGDPPT